MRQHHPPVPAAMLASACLEPRGSERQQQVGAPLGEAMKLTAVNEFIIVVNLEINVSGTNKTLRLLSLCLKDQVFPAPGLLELEWPSESQALARLSFWSSFSINLSSVQTGSTCSIGKMERTAKQGLGRNLYMEGVSVDV